MAAGSKKEAHDERREFRRRRRIRNQILAYLTLVILVGGVAAGGYFGVKAIRKGAAKDKATTETAAPAENGETSTDAAPAEDAAGVSDTEEYIPEDFTPSADFEGESGDAPETVDAEATDGEGAEGEADAGEVTEVNDLSEEAL